MVSSDNEVSTVELPKREALQLVYTSQLGVREATGNNDGKEIREYLASCGLPEGYAYCAAGVNWSHKQVGIDVDIKSPAWSPSWFSDPTKVVYRKFDHQLDFKSKKGQVLGLYYQSKGRIAHGGFIDGWSRTNYYTVEFNTNGSGSRDGDGVYRKIRSKNSIYMISDYVRDYEKEQYTIDWRKSSW